MSTFPCLKRAAKIFAMLPSEKISEAIKLGVETSVYSPEATAAELTSAQCTILAFLYGLATDDEPFCLALQDFFEAVEHLKSPSLVPWLREDFRFQGRYVFKAISKLAHLIRRQVLAVPDYVLRIFVGLNTKYHLIDFCLEANDMEAICLLMSVDLPCSKGQQTDPVTVSRTYTHFPSSSVNEVKPKRTTSKTNVDVSRTYTQFPSSSVNDVKPIRTTSKTKVDKTIIKEQVSQELSDLSVNSKNTARPTLPTKPTDISNRGRTELRTQRNDFPRDKSQHGRNGRPHGEVPKLTRTKSSPNLRQMSLYTIPNTLEEEIVQNYFSNSGPIDRSEAFKMINQWSKRDGSYPLHHASRDGLLAVVKALLKLGASVECKDDEGLTPAHYAAKLGKIEILQELKQHGADLNANDNSGSTPLHLAAWNNRVGTCEWLLNNGVGVDTQGYKGRTALHRAAMWGHLNTVRVLLAHGASVKVKDFYKNTAFDLALTQGHTLVAMMLKNNAEFTV